MVSLGPGGKLEDFLRVQEVGMHSSQGSQLFCGSEQEFALKQQAA